MAMLVVVQGTPGAPTHYELEGSEVVLGRQPDVDLRLDAREVSRRHARILLNGGQFFLEDLGSSNGTYLNSTRLQGRAELHEQDQIRIGPYLLRFEGGPSSEQDVVIRASISANTSNIELFRHDPERKLQAVLELSHQLARSLNLDELLPKLLDHLLQLFLQAERALILIMEGENLVVRCLRTRGAGRVEGPAYSRSVVRKVMEEGIGLVAEDATADRRFDMMQTINRLGIRSFLCVPFKAHDGRTLGILQLDRSGFGAPFTEEDLHLLTAVSLQVSTVLENAAMHAELLKQERMQHELALARQIQEGFLPQDFAPVTGDYELFARVYPALEVSGDFYDFMVLDGGRLGFTVADVSGKGIPAALFMTGARTLCRHLALTAESPARLLQELNTALAADNPTMMFVTMAFGMFDPGSGQLVLASGGHPPAVVRRADGHVEFVKAAAGRLLGFAPGRLPVTDTTLTLAPGDALVLYTDGVTEAAAPDRQSMFGPDRLLAAVAGVPKHGTLEAWGDHIRAAVDQYTSRGHLTDDITLLLLRRTTCPPTPQPERRASR